MEIDKAIEILHPDTTFQAITEIEYYGGFKGKEKAIEAVNEACIVACECMEKHIPKKVSNYDKCCDIYGDCPICGQSYSFEKGNEFNYCPECGQRLDWQTDLEVKTDG